MFLDFVYNVLPVLYRILVCYMSEKQVRVLRNWVFTLES